MGWIDLRDARWLSPERAWRCGIGFALVFCGLLTLHVIRHTASGVLDQSGEQLAQDFINYWAGARLAARGQAARAYDPAFFHAFQKSLVGSASQFKIYGYPPLAMMLSWPLAPLAFVPALLAWVAFGTALCVWLLSRVVEWRAAALAMIAAPPAFFNLLSGQNGCFTASLAGAGLMILNRRPAFAGVLFGLLAYKPQLGVLLPVALIAGRHWRAAAAAGVTVVLLVAASLVLLGADAWGAFAEQMVLQRRLMEAGASFWHRMPTAFAALRVLGADLPLAYGGQIVSSVLAMLAVAIVWRSRSADGIKACALVVAMFLATPYAWDYDMVVLIFGAAWLVKDMATSGAHPWQRLAAAGLVLLPLLMPPFTKVGGVQIGPVVLWMILVFLVRRSEPGRPPGGGLEATGGSPA